MEKLNKKSRDGAPLNSKAKSHQTNLFKVKMHTPRACPPLYVHTGEMRRVAPKDICYLNTSSHFSQHIYSTYMYSGQRVICLCYVCRYDVIFL